MRLPLLLLLAALAAGSARGEDASRLFLPPQDVIVGPAADRTDYASIDPAARRLYAAEMGAGKLLVFDIEHNAVVTRLDGFAKVTGVLAVPELHRVYASVPGGGVTQSLLQGLGMIGLSRGNGAVAVLDTRTLKEIARLPGGVFPDGIAYDGKDRRVFVSDELGAALTVIDADTDKPDGRIETGGEVGNVRYDAETGRIYVPVQSHNELIAVDPRSKTVVARHSLEGCAHPHGFIVAPAGKTGYVACDGNDRLFTVDLTSGRVLRQQAVAHDPDVLAVDPGTNRLYVAAESGNVSVFDVAHAEAPVALGDVFVADGAHSVAVDPATHRLYFVIADFKGHTIVRVLAPR
jgi:DNA-binding beta-propeller fold protein YncE